jgi:zinc and cadmium transporter
MMHPLDVHWVYTFGSVALVAGASFAGMAALSLSPERVSSVVRGLVSLAAGALLGTAFGHLLPESVERLGAGRKLAALLLSSFMLFFVLEKMLHVWFERLPDAGADDHAAHVHTAARREPVISLTRDRPFIANLLAGAAVHSFVDGMAIATAYSTGTSIGLIATTAVLLHETPHHIGDVSILIHKGIPVARAVGLSLAAGGTAALGALLVLLMGTQSTNITAALLPFTTANFLYIASASLIPELQHEHGLVQSLIQTTLLVGGSFLMFALSSLSG